MKKNISLILLIGFMLLFGGCSAKKNTALTRKYYAFTTKYNVHYNGKEAFRDGLKNMEESYEDDFSGTLLMHPVSSLAELETVKGNAKFDRAIEKAQKSIKLKSIKKRPVKNQKKSRDEAYKKYLKRTEYNPFLQNAWTLLGRSQFYKGDFLAAAATFQYIARNFWWLPDTQNEAYLWMGRSYTEMGWIYEAENAFSKVETEKLTKSLKQEHATAMASYLIKTEAYKEAIPFLSSALSTEKNKTQKARMTFLLAQLYESQDNDPMAYKYYGKVLNMNTNYRIAFNAQISQTEVMPKSNIKKIERKLKRMENDPRNREYLDQVFFAKGNMFLLRNDTVKAIEAFKCAVDSSKRGGMEKAVAAIKLGDLCFEREDYLKAQPAYASAVSIIPQKHNEYERVSRLSSVLDKLKDYAETVHVQDSMLLLVAMPEADRMKIINGAIKEVERLEKLAVEEARRAEYENQKENNKLNNNNQTTTTAPTINTGDNSWYFYNETAMKSGKTEFQRKWGTRRQEDNWRRKDKTSVFFTDESDSAEDKTSDIAKNTESLPESESSSDASINDSTVTDNKNPQYYLAQLPFTKEEQDNANALIEDGLFNMGIIFCRDLENFNVAIKTLKDVETRYPQSDHLLDIYYEIYLMYMRMNDNLSADFYKNKILTSFEESAYAVALKDPDYINNLRTMAMRQEQLYAETYKSYLEGNTAEVHRNYVYVKENWPLSKLMPKFMFLEALSYVSEHDADSFKGTLEQLTAAYSESDVAPLAGLMIKGLSEGRSMEGGSTMRSMAWETKFAMDGTLINDSIQEAFIEQPDIAHLLLYVYPTDSINANDLLFDVAGYNFSNYIVKDFDLDIIKFTEISMLLVKGFSNFDELSKYRKLQMESKAINIPEKVTPVMISEENFRILLNGRSFADYFKFLEDAAVASAEEPLIGSDPKTSEPIEQPLLDGVSNNDGERDKVNPENNFDITE